MKASSPHRNKTAAAFTLIELLVVIAIIGALSALVIAGLGTVRKQVDEKRTQVLIGGIENALESYKLDNNQIPDGDGSFTSSKELYQALHGDYDLDGDTDDSETVYFDKLDPYAKGKNLNVSIKEGYVIVDSWGHPLYYRSPGEMNPDFDIWSLGPNNAGGPNSSDEFSHDDIDNY